MPSHLIPHHTTPLHSHHSIPPTPTHSRRPLRLHTYTVFTNDKNIESILALAAVQFGDQADVSVGAFTTELLDKGSVSDLAMADRLASAPGLWRCTRKFSIEHFAMSLQLVPNSDKQFPVRHIVVAVAVVVVVVIVVVIVIVIIVSIIIINVTIIIIITVLLYECVKFLQFALCAP